MYAEEIQKKEPIELIKLYLENIEYDAGNSSEESINLGNEFAKEIVKIIDKFKNQGISDVQLSYHLISLLVNYIKISLIEEKAALLDIEKSLYKKEMHFLFKGK